MVPFLSTFKIVAKKAQFLVGKKLTDDFVLNILPVEFFRDDSTQTFIILFRQGSDWILAKGSSFGGTGYLGK